MSKHARMLALAATFMVVFCSAVNSASAAPRRRLEWELWSGYQIPDQSVIPRYAPGKGFVIIRGARMVCRNLMMQPDPYTFGNIQVYYETIDFMIVYADLADLEADPALGFTAERWGRFTWYDATGNKVAKGFFRYSSEDQIGYLWARGIGQYSELLVKGTFWPEPQNIGGVWVPFIAHEGEYALKG